MISDLISSNTNKRHEMPLKQRFLPKFGMIVSGVNTYFN